MAVSTNSTLKPRTYCLSLFRHLNRISTVGMPQQQHPARASWEKIHTNQALFLEANSWQREAMTIRVDSQDGFLVLIGLFVVLLLENLWSFESLTFASQAAEDAFLALLVCGAACGVFAIFSMTMIKLKLQRLMVRDVASLKAQVGETPCQLRW